MFCRNITPKIITTLTDTPVVILHGARQAGKTTLARELVGPEWPARFITFDELGVLAFAKRDPQNFITNLQGAPAILDEIQKVPELATAIKYSVDMDRQPGRFLITGSAQVLHLPHLADALVGRMEVQTLWPLSQGEMEGVREDFVDRLFGDDPWPPNPMPALAEPSLMDRIMRGGFPEAVNRQPERRQAWFESYLSNLLMRDIKDLANISGLIEIPELLSLLAARAGGLINYSDLAREAEMKLITLRRYVALLQMMFLVRLVRPWFSNRIKQLVKSEKYYFVDSGVLGHLLRITPERLQAEPKLLGLLVENFVFSELIKQISWSRTRPEIYHMRDYPGMEVDFVLEAPGGRRMVGIEVKARPTVTPADFKGLEWMAGGLGDKFHRGVVLYTGNETFTMENRFIALPIQALWRMGPGGG